jgi:xylose isomerase
LENNQKFAARLNAFKIGASDYWPGKNKITTIDLIKRAASAGLNAADLNYPDHFDYVALQDIKTVLNDTGMILNGLAMRYYTDSNFKLGAFTHPNTRIRRLAIDETKRGIDKLVALGGNMMTLWMGQDGIDYSFQADYNYLWDSTIEAMIEVADHNQNVNIGLEYKPNEPRAFSLMPDAATTILAVKDICRANIGVVIDFAHVLYADEMPAFAANLIARHSQILGVHLNDGYGKWDNGLMVGSVHPIQTIELLYELKRLNYNGVIYFDTFPDHSGLDPVSETQTNIATFTRYNEIVEQLESNKALASAIARQDAPASMQIVQAALTS